MTEESNDTGTNSISKFQGQEINKTIGPKEYLFRYLKYLPWVLACVALSLMLAKVKIRYSVPIYRVQSSLLINNDRSGNGGSGKGGERLDELIMLQPAANLSNEIEILKARPLMERVARDLGLQSQYVNTGNIRSTLLYKELPFHLLILHFADSTQGFGFSLDVKNDRQFALNKEKGLHNFNEPFTVGGNEVILLLDSSVPLRSFSVPNFTVSWAPLTEVAQGLSGSIRIVQANNSSTILTLSQETPNTKIGIDFLNTVMAVYDTSIIEDKNQISYQTLRFIDNRLDTLKAELGSVEGSMRVFLEHSHAFSIGDQSRAYLNDLEKASEAKVQQSTQLSVVNLLLDYMSNPDNNYKIVPVNLGIVEPALSQLISQYNALQLERYANLKTTGPKNQIVQGLESSLEKLRGSIFEALKNVKQAYLIAQNKSAEAESQIRGSLTALPGKSMIALNIERQQKILEDLYSFLLQKKLEITISSASTISNSKVIEPASGNNFPVSPDSHSLYLTFTLIGLILPVCFIAIREMLNDKVNSRSDIEAATNAPILGEIGHSDNLQTLVVTQHSRSFIAEQFRIIRTNLQYIVGKNDKPTILVTSSFSGEGKSFASTNLGAVMALTGKRTVIMEFDIRKPKILSGLELKRNMGITNYIIGSASFDKLPVEVRGTENLYVIPCGPIPPNPAELLLDPRLGQLMEEVKRNFDVVIMDTAPVGLVSDAITLGQYADCTMYIVRNGYTVRRMLGLAQEIYSTKKLPGLSLLLNDVKLGTGYYGSYYGGYGYSSGYSYVSESGYFEKERRERKRGIFSRISQFWKPRSSKK